MDDPEDIHIPDIQRNPRGWFHYFAENNGCLDQARLLDGLRRTFDHSLCHHGVLESTVAYCWSVTFPRGRIAIYEDEFVSSDGILQMILGQLHAEGGHDDSLNQASGYSAHCFLRADLQERFNRSMGVTDDDRGKSNYSKTKRKNVDSYTGRNKQSASSSVKKDRCFAPSIVKVPVRTKAERAPRFVNREHIACSPGSSLTGSSVIPNSRQLLTQVYQMIEEQTLGRDPVEQILLSSLNLDHVQCHLTHLSQLSAINVVDLSHNRFDAIPLCFQMDNVKIFRAAFNVFRQVELKNSMNGLIELDLYSNEIEKFPSVFMLSHMPTLKTLRLCENKIEDLPPDTVVYLSKSGLEYLDLSLNLLKYLPDEIGSVTALKVLMLGKNSIQQLPSSITNLKNLITLDLSENGLINPPQDVADLGMPGISDYFESKNKYQFKRFKVIVVGHEKSGKSSVVSSLMTHIAQQDDLPPCMRDFPLVGMRQQSSEDGGPSLVRQRSDMSSVSQLSQVPSAAGRTIAMDIKMLKLNYFRSVPRDSEGDESSSLDSGSIEDVVTLNIWDFAGQEVYHSAHEVFFSDHALYLVVWNMTENSELDIENKVQFWIDLIQARVPGSKIIVVCTHADKCDDTSEDIRYKLDQALRVNEELRMMDLRHELGELHEVLEKQELDSDEYRQTKKKMDVLKNSYNKRPDIICCVNVVSETDEHGFTKEKNYDVVELVSAISNISMSTSRGQHPFKLANSEQPRYFELVHKVIQRMSDHRWVTLEDLHNAAKEESQLNVYLRHTRAAVSFLSCIGEVVWFRNRDVIAEDHDEYQMYTKVDEISEDESEPQDTPFRTSRGIESYVILDPHWLIKSIKGILTHEFTDTVDRVRSRSDVHSNPHLGEPYDEKNGIFRWIFLEKLLEISSEIDANHKDFRSTMDLFRVLLERFHVIIPVRMDFNQGGSPKSPTKHAFEDSHVEGRAAPTGIGSLITTYHVRSSEMHKSFSATAVNQLSPRTPNSTSTQSTKTAAQTPVGPQLTPAQTPKRTKSTVDDMNLAYGPNHNATAAFDQSMTQPPAAAPALVRGHSNSTSALDRQFQTPRVDRGRTLGHASISSSSSLSNLKEDFFLVPARLPRQNITPKIPRYPRPGQIRLMRKFNLLRFVPPGLIPRIIACAYRFIGRAPIASRQSSATNQCWKTVLSQLHSSVHVWLWLEDYSELLNQKILEDESSNSKVVVKACIKVVGFGSNEKNIIQWLDKYCAAVSLVLKEFPGLCCFSLKTVCPTCILVEVYDEDCGEFDDHDLRNELDCYTRMLKMMKDVVKFEDRSLICPSRGCPIPLNLLIEDPTNDSESGIPKVDEKDKRIMYLTKELIRLSAVLSEICEKPVVFIAMAVMLTEDVKKIKSCRPGEPIPQPLVATTTSFASGSFCRISAQSGPVDVILSCAHFCIDKIHQSYPLMPFICTPDHELVYLVGDSDNWLHMAELITLGSAFASRAITDDLKNCSQKVEPGYYICTFCQTKNPLKELLCLNKGCGRRRPGEGFWDVSAFALTHSFEPYPRKKTHGEMDGKLVEQYVMISPVDNSFNIRRRNGAAESASYDVSPEPAMRDQSLRLLGFSGGNDLSIDWGGVISNMDGLFLLNGVYNDYGASGGPVVDQAGRITGVLSCVLPEKDFTKAYIESVHIFVSFLKKHQFSTDGRHFPDKCEYCEQHPIIKEKFSIHEMKVPIV